jgi:branched-chain amino acid transport system substrate-binding protein
LRYKERYGKEPESYAAASYDACAVLLRAIERVGRGDRRAIAKEVLATRDYNGLLGRWSFDVNGDIVLPEMSRLAIRDGRFAFLGTAPMPLVPG